MIVRWAGDTLLLVEWEQTIDVAINRQVMALAERVRVRAVAGVRDIVPGYCSLGLHVDPLNADVGALERIIGDRTENASDADENDQRLVQLPVRYGGQHGPDLASIAASAGCTPEEVVELHTTPTYRVYMLGFVPGFAYLGRVDRRIAAPRHHTPRDLVPAGSVGIAGEQTGVYPRATPGGWQLIGRTEAVMFDARREPPSLLQPGNLVRFVAIA